MVLTTIPDSIVEGRHGLDKFVYPRSPQRVDTCIVACLPSPTRSNGVSPNPGAERA